MKKQQNQVYSETRRSYSRTAGFLKFMDSRKRIRGLCRMLKAWAETEEKKDLLERKLNRRNGSAFLRSAGELLLLPFLSARHKRAEAD